MNEEEENSSFSMENASDASPQSKKSTVKLKEVLVEQRKKVDLLQEEKLKMNAELQQIENVLMRMPK